MILLSAERNTIGDNATMTLRRSLWLIRKGLRKKSMRHSNLWNQDKNTLRLNLKSYKDSRPWAKAKGYKGFKKNLINGSRPYKDSSVQNLNPKIKDYNLDQRQSSNSGKRECRLLQIGQNNSKTKISTWWKWLWLNTSKMKERRKANKTLTNLC